MIAPISFRVLFQLLVAFLVLFAAPPSQALDAGPADVSMDIGYVVDPTRSLGLADILALAPERFQRSERSDLNFGYTHDAAWLRVIVQAESDRALLLSMSPNFVDLVDIYVAPLGVGTSIRDFRHIATGDHRSVPRDGFSGLHDIVELDLKAGQPMVAYIRLAAIGSVLTTNVQLIAKAEQPTYEAMVTLVTGAWFGAAAILVVIQLVFYYYDRRPHYILLALSTVTAFITYVGTLGISRLLLFPDGGAGNDIFVSASLWFGLTVTALAAAFILDLRENSRWLFRIFLAIALAGLIGAALGVAGLNLFFAPIGSLIGVVLTALAAFQAVRTASSGGTATWLRAAAYIVLWIGVVITMAQRTALADWPNWAAHTYAVACVLQVILLTAALGVRLRAAETLNRVMQGQALVAARAAEEYANALVEERTRELAAASKTAEDALEAELQSQRQQMRFMEVVSHQYRTPLAAIRSSIDSIGLSLAGDDGANRTRIASVRRSIGWLVEILEVNLARSALQGASFHPQFSSVALGSVLSAACQRADDLLNSPAIHVDLPSGSADLRIRADAGMLELAILNLLENAVKYTAPKGEAAVTLALETESPADGRSRVAITVRDRGIGIPAADLPHVFHSAFRGSNTGGAEGTGMGLPLVAKIVTVHGGTVDVESAEGEGTSVRITLPLEAG